MAAQAFDSQSEAGEEDDDVDTNTVYVSLAPPLSGTVPDSVPPLSVLIVSLHPPPSPLAPSLGSGVGSVVDAEEPEVVRLSRHAERLRRAVARLKRLRSADEEVWKARLADAVAMVRQEGHERLHRAMTVRWMGGMGSGGLPCIVDGCLVQGAVVRSG